MNTFAKKAVAIALTVLAGTSMALPLDDISGVATTWKLKGITTELETYTKPSQVGFAGGFGAGALKETTWGVGEITGIDDVNSNNLFLGGAGDRLYYMIYGIADLVIDNPGGGSTFNIYNIGCTGGVGVAACDGKIHIDIYRTTSTIVNLTLKDPHNRTGFGTYSGVTDLPGSLYLGLTLAPGKVTGSGALRDSATLFQTTNSALLPASGTGTFFADVNAGAAGGSARAKWDSNGIDTGIGTLVDFDGNFTLKPNIRNGAGGIPGGTGACTAAAVAANTCFGGLINDPVQATALPEPGSLALAGLALAGLAAVGRRARAAKA